MCNSKQLILLHVDKGISSSFPVIHEVGKVDKVDIFVLLKFENKLDIVLG